MSRRPTYNERDNRVDILEKAMAGQASTKVMVQEAYDRLERVTEGLLGPLMIINKEFTIEEANERFLKRYGHQKEDVIDHPCYEVTRGFRKPCFENGLFCPAKAVLETARPYSAEHTHHHNHKTGTVEDLFAFPLFGKDGEVAHVVEVCHDRKTGVWETVEKNEQERLEGVIEMAGAVCLELNQPLQALSFHCERLQKAVSEENLLYNQIEWIVRKIDQMSEILGKLQYIAKYATKDHIEGTKIVDIDRASRSDA